MHPADGLSVYPIYSQPLTDDGDEGSSDIKAYKKIGAIWHDLLEELKKRETLETKERVVSLLSSLGVDERDTLAQEDLIYMLKNLMPGNGLHLKPITASSGAYFLKNGDDKILAIFKIGARRGNMELCVRRTAREFGLERYILPGIFCVMENPEISSRNPPIEELFAPYKLVYESDEGLGISTKVTGILEPYVEEDGHKISEEASFALYSRIMFLALLLELRDTKIDGIKSGTVGARVEDGVLVDTEDSFPPYADLPAESDIDRSYAPTNLPILNDLFEYLRRPFSKETQAEFLEILTRCDIEKMVVEMRGFKKAFAERKYEAKAVELMEQDYLGEIDEPEDEEGDGDYTDNGFTGGSSTVSLEKLEVSLEMAFFDELRKHCSEKEWNKAFTEYLDYLDSDSLLSSLQLDAFKSRFLRLKQGLQEGKVVDILSMICAVDPIFEAQRQVFLVSRTDQRRAGAESFSHLGAQTPVEIGCAIPDVLRKIGLVVPSRKGLQDDAMPSPGGPASSRLFAPISSPTP